MPDLKWMQLEVMNNTMAVWLTAAAVLIGGLLVVLLAHRFVLRPILRRFARAREAAAVDKAAATEASAPETMQAPQIGLSAGAALSATVSNALDKFERKMRFFLVSLVIYLSFQIPGWGEKLEPVVNGLVSVLLVLASVSLLLGVYQYVMSRMMAAREEDAARVHALRTVNFLVRLAVWVLALVLILDNFGVNVSTLLAGLGIGGIAIALAAQTVLGDLFSGLVIFFDRPFELGDFISVGEHMGSVEKIGIKTSRIRSIGGEQIVLPNTDLTSARIRNFKRLQRRRVVFTVGVAYETPTEKLRQIPGWIAEIISAQETATFDRAHFVTYGDSALQYEIVFFIETSEYLVYMDIRQQVNLDIKEKFESEGIDFAYPTRTVFVKSMP
jgi:small-conductance mechanosensitive channel